MAKLPWVDFIATHPRAHLAAAGIVHTRSAQHLSRLHNLLQQVTGEQDPAADFATAIVRPTDVAQIHCGFADKTDADRLARLTRARLTRVRAAAKSLGEWTSHRSFRLDAAKEAALADALVSRKNVRP